MKIGKESLLQEVKARVQHSSYLILVEYKGMKVSELSELRKRLTAAGARLTVVKNTYLRQVSRESGLPDFSGLLQGQNAIVTGNNELCATAKIIKNFHSEFSKPLMKGGCYGEAFLTAQQILVLADLPSREVLFSQLLSLINTPASRLLMLLTAPAEKLVRTLQQKASNTT